MAKTPVAPEAAPEVTPEVTPVAPVEPFAEEKAAALGSGAAAAYVIESPNPGVSPALRVDN